MGKEVTSLFAGRPRGSVNKSTLMSELRRSLKDRGIEIPDIISTIMRDKKCEIKDKIRIVEICIEYLYPKLKPVIVDETEQANNGKVIPLTVSITDLIKIAKDEDSKEGS